jgi:DNA-directed RNA polymerase specialized sigma24 family protein
MLTIASTRRNFGLTQDQFDLMVEQLGRGDEALFETIFVQHFSACLNGLKKKYRAPHEDAYDSSMWAMLRVRELLAEKKIGFNNLESYIFRMAANHYLKKLTRNREMTVENLPDVAEHDEPAFDEETMGILEKSWSKLGEKCQLLLKGFYYDRIELKHLTQLLGDSSEANTRKRKERCMLELRKLFFRSY